MNNETLPLKKVFLSVFFISSALLAYEVTLIRLFSIQYWHHFAHLIISIALLGFGVSGTAIFLFSNYLRNRATDVFWYIPFLVVLSMVLNSYISKTIFFNPLLAPWQPQILFHFVFLILLMFVPFFLGSLCIGVAFLIFTAKVNIIYACNLFGSAIGVLIVLSGSFFLGLNQIIFSILLIVIAAAIPFAMTTRRITALLLISAVAALSFNHMHADSSISMNPFKDLKQSERLKDAKIEAEIFGPLGLINILDSPAFHYLPDLSLSYTGPLPQQKGLFIDGNLEGAITEYGGEHDNLSFMEFRTSSLPYRLLKHPDVLIIGGGGGTEILNAIYHNARRITVVEMNRGVVELLEKKYSTFSGDLYKTDLCDAVIAGGRGFLESSHEKFDIIKISLLGSLGPASAGLYSLSVNYLITVDAMRTMMKRLSECGMISISGWIHHPPREMIKLIGMASDVLNKSVELPYRSMVVIRSWQTATILLKNKAFKASDIEIIRQFCDRNAFDVCYYPGILESKTNRINKLSTNYFYRAAVFFLEHQSDSLFESYPYDIYPASDDRPFFSHFFRWQSIKTLLYSGERGLIPFIDWSYVLLWMTVVILAGFSIVFIILPLLFNHMTLNRSSLGILLYFGTLGTAYIFLELAFVQKFILLLFNPVFSSSVVISSFLFFSGIGSMFSQRLMKENNKYILLSFIAVAVIAITYVICESFIAKSFLKFPLATRIVLCIALNVPVAFFMGFPFPSGLLMVNNQYPHLIPWAWGINGFFSVTGTSLAVISAIHGGITVVILIAGIMYLLAGFVYVTALLKR